MMTPDSAEWDPYSEHYARNEKSMSDFEGNIVERRFWKRHKAREICASQMSQDGYNTLVDTVYAQFSALDTRFESSDDCQFYGVQRSAIDFSDALLHEVEKMAESLGPGHATASSVDALFEDRNFWILIRYRLRLLLPLVLNRRNCLLISLPRYGVLRMKRLRKFWNRQPYCCGRVLLMIYLGDIPLMTELYDTSVFVVSFIPIPSLLPSLASLNGVIPVLRCL